MKNTIVIGATGTIGSAVSQLLQTKGYEVIKASRHTESSIDIEDTESIETFFTKTGQIDAIICAAGNASFGTWVFRCDHATDFGVMVPLKKITAML